MALGLGSNPRLTRSRGYRHKRSKKKSKSQSKSQSQSEKSGGGFRDFFMLKGTVENTKSVSEPKEGDLPESVQDLTLTDLYYLYPEGIPLKLFCLDKSQIKTIIQRQKEMDEKNKKS